MIVVDRITKTYPLIGLRRHTVFRDLSLVIPERRNVGILGRNGAGKTTLLRLIADVDVPDRGTITVTNAGSISPPLGISVGMAASITGRANAKFVCRVHGDDPATLRERVAFIERFAEIGEFFDMPVMFYSSGMKARLNFAIAMAYDYDYYLIDELTAVGDESFRRKASQVFRAKRGRASMVIVSHTLKALQDECQSGIYVRHGGAEWFEDIRDAIAAYQQDRQKEDAT